MVTLKKIAKLTFPFLIFFIGIHVHGQNFNARQSFDHHFKILDSLSFCTSADTIYTVKHVESVSFMEKNTKIYSSTSGNFYGRLGFTKEDLRMWHEWYEKKYSKKKMKLGNNKPSAEIDKTRTL